MYPRLWSDTFETVYTFEPSPLNWYCLTQNCPSERIKKFNVALGEHDQKNWLKLGNIGNVGTNTIASQEVTDAIMIDMMPLDAYELECCDVIQLDIEGYEPAALLGAIKTIEKFRPVICLETKNPGDQSQILLTSWGYKSVAETRFDTVFVPV